MNNRLFLYSGLFLVLILLYDAWHNKNQPTTIVQNNMPETNSDYIPDDRPSKQNPEANLSEAPDTPSIATSDAITVTTDSLEVMISLLDGSIISAKLLQYPEVFGTNERKVQLLDSTTEHYIAKIGLQSKNLEQPKNIFHV